MYRKIVFAVAAFSVAIPFLASAASCPTLSRNLSFGARGQDVVELQNFLIEQNLLGAGNNTGYFGRLTKAAVIKFQIRRNLPSTGLVGPLTRAAIAKICTNIDSTKNTQPDFYLTSKKDAYEIGEYVYISLMSYKESIRSGKASFVLTRPDGSRIEKGDIQFQPPALYPCDPSPMAGECPIYSTSFSLPSVQFTTDDIDQVGTYVVSVVGDEEGEQFNTQYSFKVDSDRIRTLFIDAMGNYRLRNKSKVAWTGAQPLPDNFVASYGYGNQGISERNIVVNVIVENSENQLAHYKETTGLGSNTLSQLQLRIQSNQRIDFKPADSNGYFVALWTSGAYIILIQGFQEQFAQEQSSFVDAYLQKYPSTLK